MRPGCNLQAGIQANLALGFPADRDVRAADDNIRIGRASKLTGCTAGEVAAVDRRLCHAEMGGLFSRNQQVRERQRLDPDAKSWRRPGGVST
jgi:hypothetical protein